MIKRLEEMERICVYTGLGLEDCGYFFGGEWALDTAGLGGAVWHQEVARVHHITPPNCTAPFLLGSAARTTHFLPHPDISNFNFKQRDLYNSAFKISDQKSGTQFKILRNF